MRVASLPPALRATSLAEGGRTGGYDNPSVNAARCHLPLHKGGRGFPRLRARGYGFPRQCEHWLGMTTQEANANNPSVNAVRCHLPLHKGGFMPRRCRGVGRTESSAPTEGCKGCLRATTGGVEPCPYGRTTRVRCVNVSLSVKTFGFDTSLTEGGRGFLRLRARRRELEGANGVFNRVCGAFLCDVPTLAGKRKTALTLGWGSAIIRIVH